MRINEVLEKIEKIKPNAIDDYVLRSWIEEIDHKIYTEIVNIEAPNDNEQIQSENERYPFGSENVELLAKDEYSNIYLYYVAAQIDFWNNDFDKYNNAMIMFNNAYEAYSAWYTRTHKSLMPRKITVS